MVALRFDELMASILARLAVHDSGKLGGIDSGAWQRWDLARRTTRRFSPSETIFRQKCRCLKLVAAREQETYVYAAKHSSCFSQY